METELLSMPGYRLYEYLLVITPHEDLRNRIIQVKKDFHHEFKTPVANNGKPHIALVHYVQYEMMEERIVGRLKLIGMGYPPFKVELNDFGSFPSHSIFMNVATKLPIQNLVKEVRSQAQRLMKLNNETRPHFILEPHIPVASKLLPWQYEKGWLKYSANHFNSRFIADAMLLLKRPVGDRHYQVAQRFEFQNLPVTTRQGELFG